MKFLMHKSIFVVLGSILLYSCQKEKQDETGPENPTTTTVYQGHGVIETHQRQPNGNLVIFSNWISKPDADWTGLGTHQANSEILTSSLTNEVRDRGLVLVYYGYDAKTYMLPITDLENQITADFHVMTGKINLTIKYLNGIINGLAGGSYRYILVPASAFSNAGSGRTATAVDFSDYDAVCAYYGIPR